MGLSESDTRDKLLDPAIHARGWTGDVIRREETARDIHIIGDKPRRRAKGRVDYVLRINIKPDNQTVYERIRGVRKEDLVGKPFA